jgi:hypothetical protein
MQESARFATFPVLLYMTFRRIAIVMMERSAMVLKSARDCINVIMIALLTAQSTTYHKSPHVTATQTTIRSHSIIEQLSHLYATKSGMLAQQDQAQ